MKSTKGAKDANGTKGTKGAKVTNMPFVSFVPFALIEITPTAKQHLGTLLCAVQGPDRERTQFSGKVRR